ncbi:secretory phospholipase A2 receptor-like isoform X1, partial [Silurus asotus]
FTGLLPLIQSVPRKYYLIQQEKTWSDAQAFCRAEYTDLATVETNDDLTKLQNEAQRQQFSSSAWIGLYIDLTGWRWSLGNEPLGITLWAATQPDNAGGHEECGAIDTWGWIDSICTLPLSFVCFAERIRGPDNYIKVLDRNTWFDAQSYCRQHYTDLASARDITENTLIKGLLSEWTWFGLFRDSWKWSDQTMFSTLSWMSVNALGSNDCIYWSTGQAADAPCSDTKPFFCYSGEF